MWLSTKHEFSRLQALGSCKGPLHDAGYKLSTASCIYHYVLCYMLGLHSQDQSEWTIASMWPQQVQLAGEHVTASAVHTLPHILCSAACIGMWRCIRLCQVQAACIAPGMQSSVADVSKMHTVGHADTALGPSIQSCSDSTGDVSSLCRSRGLQYQALLSTDTQHVLYVDRQD